MERIAAQFERLVEKFLTGDLERRTRILSWATLILLGFCLLGVLLLSTVHIPVKDSETGETNRVPVRRLLFK